jgi:hypothetical protein
MTGATVNVRAPAAPPGTTALAWLVRRRDILGWWLGSRALVLGAVLCVHLAGAPRGYFGKQALEEPLGILRAWDGIWYSRIAAHGYLMVPGRQSDPAFFPLFPLLMKTLHPLGLSYGGAGILISNVLLLPALLALYEVARRWVPEATARRAAIFAAIFPLGYVFSMAYPESFVLAAVALATLCAYRDRWLLAAFLGAAAALARPEGLLLSIPLAALAWSRRRGGTALGAVLAPIAALASFPLYLGHALHDPGAWSQAETAWGRKFGPGGPLHAVTSLPGLVAHTPLLARDVVFFGVYLLLLAAAWRAGVPRAWIAAGAAMVALPVASGSFESDGRFGLLALPVYVGLAALARGRRTELALRIGCLVLLAAATVTIPEAFP